MKLNLSSQTFRSHYRFFTSDKTEDAEFRLKQMARDKFQYSEKSTDDIGLLTQGIYGEAFISAGDKYDKKIESILASRGIKFEKTPLDVMKSEKSVLSRIEQTPYDKNKDYYLLDVDVEKFDEIFAQNQQYIGKYGAGGIGTRYSDFIKYMESGMPIHASTVVVTEENNRPIVSFVDGRHRYSVMRDLGFERIRQHPGCRKMEHFLFFMIPCFELALVVQFYL